MTLRTAALSASLGVVALLSSGCAGPEYRYVNDTDRAVVMRMPYSWAPVDTAKALKATGVDPAEATGWTAFFDAAKRPGVAHIGSATTEDPVLFAQSIPVAQEQRSQITDEQLRELMLPGTATERAAAQKDRSFRLLRDTKVSTPTQYGFRVRYASTAGGRTELFDRIALTDPKRTAIHVIFVHCSERCFARRSGEIDGVVSSLTLKPH